MIDNLQDYFQWGLQHGPELIEAAWWLLTAAAIIAALTPTDADDRIIGRLKNLLRKIRKTPDAT